MGVIKKIIMLLVVFCVTSMCALARNAIVRYQYWFNGDFDHAVVVQQDSTTNLSLSASIDANSLSEGLHVLNLRFQDANGLWSAAKSQFFLKSAPLVTSDNKIARCQYWLDADFSGAITTPTSSAQDIVFDPSLNVAALSEGLHVLNLRFQDVKGKWSSAKSQFFLKMSPKTTVDSKITLCQYWIDFDFAKAVSTPTTSAKDIVFNPNLDMEAIGEGLHVLNMRFQDVNGKWSSAKSQFFIKMSPKTTADSKISLCQYWIDTDFAKAVSTPTTSAKDIVFNPNLDMEAIGEGLHVLNMRFQDVNGKWSSAKSQFFIKMTPKATAGSKITFCQYWIDSDFNNAVTSPTASAKDIVYDPSLSLEKVGEGLHVLNMRFQDANGKWSSAKSQFFIKKAYKNSADEAKVVSYQYWFDDNFVDAKVLTVDKAAKDVDISKNLDLRRVPKGVHYLNFRAMDSHGLWSSAVTDTVEKISLPIADFTIDTISVTCQYITLRFNDNSIDGDSIAWNFGDGSAVDTTRNPVHEFVEGDYAVSLSVVDTTLGKDSVKAMPLSLQKLRIYELFAETACDSFVWNKETYFTSGDYVQTFQTESGCDSIVTLHLTVNKHVETEISEEFKQPFVWNDTTYMGPGDFKQTFVSQSGCDSVVVLHLVITTDVEDVSASQLIMYPVPVADHLTIEYSGKIDYVEMFTSTGQFLKRVPVADTNVDCDISSLPEGLYAITIHPMDKRQKPIQRTFLVHRK